MLWCHGRASPTLRCKDLLTGIILGGPWSFKSMNTAVLRRELLAHTHSSMFASIVELFEVIVLAGTWNVLVNYDLNSVMLFLRQLVSTRARPMTLSCASMGSTALKLPSMMVAADLRIRVAWPPQTERLLGLVMRLERVQSFSTL